MKNYLRAKRVATDKERLTLFGRISSNIVDFLVKIFFKWLFVFLTVTTLISMCVLLVLVLLKVHEGDYSSALKLSAVMVTLVIINVTVEPGK